MRDVSAGEIREQRDVISPLFAHLTAMKEVSRAGKADQLAYSRGKSRSNALSEVALNGAWVDGDYSTPCVRCRAKIAAN